MRTTRMVVSLMLLSCTALSTAAPVPSTASPVAFREIARGEISGFRFNSPDFTGAEIHISDRASWLEFWSLHTHGMSPAPLLPEVRFSQESVIVVLLGYQTTGGGPSIGVRGVSRSDRSANVEVLEDRTPGPLDVITNPYQIIATPALGRSVAFLHTEPGERLCQTPLDCQADHVCTRVDPTCASPVTGQCSYQPPGSACPEVEMPVCGCDGVTYSNGCFLDLAGAVFAHLGACS